MRRLFKIIITSFIALMILACICLATLSISSDSQIADMESQQQMKAGKDFWEWKSPYGSLNMHYVEKGEGDNHILLLHGFRAHSFTWKALIEPLAKEGYHVWAIDYIGYGLSDKPIDVVYNVDFFLEQIDAFMEGKKIKKTHLIGNSMGGGLALSTALAHPETIKSLILLDALGYQLDMPLYLSLSKYLGPICAPLIGPSLIRYGLKQIMCNQHLVSEEQVEAYCLPYRFPGGVTASILTLQEFDNHRLAKMESQYHSLIHPTLIIWGDQDKLIPVSHYHKFVKDFPFADTLLISDCGHIPQEEAPDEVFAAVLEFLKKTDVKIKDENPTKS